MVVKINNTQFPKLLRIIPSTVLGISIVLAQPQVVGAICNTSQCDVTNSGKWKQGKQLQTRNYFFEGIE
ncbi:hypothetical protein [Anabaena sp. CS-542/02]|uniref:hypothetical protein n=1 Tax=Anabaena sp. CS-542/02 TaxID=3021719 RepID=UPI00232B298F|nr:hypothetical protein [Anabaena sp. CS-542/02]